MIGVRFWVRCSSWIDSLEAGIDYDGYSMYSKWLEVRVERFAFL